jgi:RimJ/RimL family protein N-acetyltransferase
MNPPEMFVTARLRARPPRAEDAAAVFAGYAADPAVTRYLSWRAHERIETVEVFLRRQAESWARGGGPYVWMLCLPEAPEPVGSIGFSVEGGKALFGYVLAKRLWGRGLMAEALRCLADWSLAQPEIYRAWAFCDAENAASVRVMEKSGMAREGRLRRWHVCPTIGPEPRDCIVCAKVR